jgi:hypothetical protein
MRIRDLVLVLCGFALASPVRAQDDVVMKAMHDELDRSMKQLQLEKLDKPYFISYRVVDSENTNVAASFGALEHSSQGHSRRFTVEVRVGDHSLDNTNFFFFTFDPASLMQVFGGTTELPLDDDYRELRRQMWLATDATYKKAVEDLSKKRAALENKVDPDRAPDFTREEPFQAKLDAAPIQVERAAWEAEARSLSGLFRQMRDIETSTVTFSATNSYIRYSNTEGTSYTRQEPRATFTAHAAAQAADGLSLEDTVWLYQRSLDKLPSADQLRAMVQALGRRLSDLRDASEIDHYNGPVLVEGDAAAQLFRWVFLPHLVGTRPPLMDTTMYSQLSQGNENPFLDEIGARVLPTFLSVTDNPLLADYKDLALAGTCKVDEDGVPGREVLLVDKGILQTLLVSRDPVRGLSHSTGSRHGGQVSPSNVFVTAENGLSDSDLRAKFIDLVKQRHKDFGIAIRRMRNAQHPVLAYKVYPDGREELIRNVQISELNLSAFKDIVAASENQNLLTLEYRPPNSTRLPFLASAGDEGYAPVTLAVPSLVFEDVTVGKVRGETATPPIVPAPSFADKPR